MSFAGFLEGQAGVGRGLSAGPSPPINIIDFAATTATLLVVIAGLWWIFRHSGLFSDVKVTDLLHKSFSRKEKRWCFLVFIFAAPTSLFWAWSRFNIVNGYQSPWFWAISAAALVSLIGWLAWKHTWGLLFAWLKMRDRE